MLPCIDLLALLRSQNGSLAGVSVYGRVNSFCERPATLGLTVKLMPGGSFVSFDMLAVDFSGCRSSVKSTLNNMGIDDKMYFVNGSIVTYVPNTVRVNEWGVVQGTLILSKRSKQPLVSMLSLSKDKSRWILNKSCFGDIILGELDSEVRSVIQSCCSHNTFERPDEVNNFEPCLAEISTSDILRPKILDNNELQQWSGVSVRTPELKTSDRDIILPKSDRVIQLQNSCNELIKNRRDYISGVRNRFALSSKVYNNIRFTFSRLSTYFRRGTGASHTGLDILISYMKKMKAADTAKGYTDYVEHYIRSHHKELFDCCLNGDSFFFTGTSDEMLVMQCLFGTHEVTYAGILATVLDLDITKLRQVASDCLSNLLSFSRIVDENPYVLAILFPDLDLSIIEKLALCFGRANSEDLRGYKNAVYVWRNLYSCVCGATICLDKDLYKRKIGVSITREEYNRLLRKDGVFDIFTLSDIELFINSGISLSDTSYPHTKWLQNKMKGYVQCLTKDEIISCRKSFHYLGLVENFEINNNSWSVAVDVLLKEIFIYNFLQDLERSNKTKSSFDDIILDNLISEFETKTGTHLDEKHRKAVKSIKHNAFAISDCIGSDKNLVLSCLNYVLENYSEASDPADIRVVYASATQGSAEVLSSVIGKPVELIDSLYKCGTGVSYTSLDYANTKSVCVSADVLILDDTSAISLDTMYRVLKQTEVSKIIFIGDVNKLPSSDSGTPFKDMLRYLPSVHLSVTDDSLNSALILNARVIQDVEIPLSEGDNFKLIPCGDNELSDICSLIYEYHFEPEQRHFILPRLRKLGVSDDVLVALDNLSPDDIQVVSISDESRNVWSASSVSNSLKNKCNPVGRGVRSFKSVYTESNQVTFSVGDTVISTDTDYSAQWYSLSGANRFTKDNNTGVVKGDVGKIIALMSVSSCIFENSASSGIIASRDVEANSNIGSYFVVVEYSDSTPSGRHCVLYRGTESDEHSTYELLALKGDDMSKLKLAYCITPDNLKSRKKKLVIVLLGNTGKVESISRNMIYNSMSCATDAVYLLGSVTLDDDSQLSVARRFDAGKYRHTICSYMVGE